MILYEVVLLDAVTNEELFHALDATPRLPSLSFYERTPKPVLTIVTRSISETEWKKRCQHNLTSKN